MNKIFVFVLLIGIGWSYGVAGQEYQVVEDLHLHWQIQKSTGLEAYQGEEISTIHLPLSLQRRKGQFLSIESSQRFYIYVQSKLVGVGIGTRYLRTDSLMNRYGSTLQCSIYQAGGIHDLRTKLVTFNPLDPMDVMPRRGDYFFNFTLSASLLLLIFFTALFRTNPQLTFDYFNVTKLFSLKDRDENLLSMRITSSINLIFYLFCSLLSGLILLMIIQVSGGGWNFLSLYRTESLGMTILRWVEISAVILLCLILKLTVLFLLSWLFRFKDTATFQFFHSVRILMLTLIVVAGVSTIYFSLGVSPARYYGLLKMACFIFVLGTILIYFKLLARQVYSIFHLFFYLCASEIIPLVILIKVLLF